MSVHSLLKKLDEDANVNEWLVHVNGTERDLTDTMIAMVGSMERIADGRNPGGWANLSREEMTIIARKAVDSLKDKLS